jgi:hypothetical protein
MPVDFVSYAAADTLHRIRQIEDTLMTASAEAGILFGISSLPSW